MGRLNASLTINDLIKKQRSRIEHWNRNTGMMIWIWPVQNEKTRDEKMKRRHRHKMAFSAVDLPFTGFYILLGWRLHQHYHHVPLEDLVVLQEAHYLIRNPGGLMNKLMSLTSLNNHTSSSNWPSSSSSSNSSNSSSSSIISYSRALPVK